MAPNDLKWSIEGFDLASWALDHGAVHVGSGPEVLMTCPQCGKQKLAINVERKFWHCFVCESAGVGKGQKGRGGLLDLLQMVGGMTRSDACEYVAQNASKGFIPKVLPSLFGDKRRSAMTWALPIAFPCMSVPIDTTLYESLPFLRRRGIGLVDCLAYRLHLATAGRFSGRIIFPVFENGHLVYFQARATWDAQDEPENRRYIKVLNPHRDESQGTTSNDVLFNFDMAKVHDRIAIVEGPIDAIRAGPDAMATLGKKISSWQVAKLRQTCVRAIDLCWDGPGPTEPQGAWPEMVKAAPYLSTFFEVRLVALPHGDPGSKTTEEISYYRSQAIPWSVLSSNVGK